MISPYDFPRKYRSCMNCVHLDQPEGKVGGKVVGGCRNRLTGFGVTESMLGEMYCGEWYLKQLKEEY